MAGSYGLLFGFAKFERSQAVGGGDHCRALVLSHALDGISSFLAVTVESVVGDNP